MQVDTRTILYKVAKLFDLKRGSTKERLKLQKTIYLLQVYGFRLGYGFSWYRYGPYSQDLVYDAYTVLVSEKDKYNEYSRSWQFSDNTLTRFDRFKGICGSVLSDPKKLELAASVDFVRKTWHQSATRLEMPRIFKTYKQLYFNRELIQDPEVKEAFDLIVRLKPS